MSSRAWRARGLSCPLWRRVLAAGLVATAPGCSRPEANESPPEVPSERAARVPLVSASAFELAPAAGGALLAWAPQHARQILRRRFDAEGVAAPTGSGSLAVEREVVELALASTDAGEVLAWREGGEAGMLTRAAWLGPDGASQRFELGSGGLVSAQRGAMSLGVRGNEALLFARAGDTPCEGGASEPCTSFQLHRLSANGTRPAGFPLAVPSPCESQAAQLVLAPGRAPGSGEGIGRFDYAICSRAGTSRVLTVFSIQPSPAYAMAEDVFAGCTPLGAGRFAGQATFVADCGAIRRLATAPGGGESLVVRDLDPRGLICRQGAASLAFGGSWLALDEPLGQLQLLLGDDLAPPGARAVWTGAALLVARVDDAARLHVTRHVCSGNVLSERSEWSDVGDAGGNRGRP